MNQPEAKSKFLEVIKTEFAPSLRSIGFTGSGQDFRRLIGPVAHVINLQGDKIGRGCYLNLGLHAECIDLGGKVVDFKKIKEIDCAFRRRCMPEGKSDYMWTYEKPELAAKNLIETYFRQGEPLFQQFDTLMKIGKIAPVKEPGQTRILTPFSYIGLLQLTVIQAQILLAQGNLEWAKVYAQRAFDMQGGNRGLYRRQCLEILEIAL